MASSSTMLVMTGTSTLVLKVIGKRARSFSMASGIWQID